MTGDTLTHYEILGLLGKGGMGEVYRARDTKLDRQVAIKVLPDVLAGDPDRLSRFRREAKLLASINHPNIAAIHEVDRDGGTNFLVMELVEGPGLDDLLSKGPMELDTVLSLFSQLAEGLEYAHERGIVHRDLKPANIKITDDGRVKILDFGLARATETAAAVTSTDGTVALDSSSQARSARTAEGRILGTPAYMSPEQGRGQTVDKRTDIWAFGCCLYEALTGKPTFHGATVTDVLAEIIKSDPDWDALPRNTPARVRVLLWRCLQKDPKRRLRDIGEARLDLGGEWTDPSGVLPALGTTAAPAGFGRRTLLAAAAIALVAGGLLAGAATWSVMRHRAAGTVDSASLPVKRFEIDIGKTVPLSMLRVSAEIALSPDGRRIAYTADLTGRRQLYLRDLDRIQSTVFPGIENAWRPFFSPDGRWVGYFVPGSLASRSGKLMKVAVDGGDPLEVCNAFPPAGATWLSDDSIVFTSQDDTLDTTVDPFRTILFHVSAQGGTPTRLMKAIDKDPATSQVLPRSIPGKNVLLFTVSRSGYYPRAVLYDLATGKTDTLVKNALNAQYVEPGYLAFSRGNTLWAAAFDPSSRELGEPVSIESNVQMDLGSNTACFAVSTEGSFVFAPLLPSRESLRTLVWVTHDGNEETISVRPAQYWWPRVSPDGSRVAVSIPDPKSGDWDIWIHQFGRPLSMTRFTFDPVHGNNALWSPDGRYIYFASGRRDSVDLFRRRADGTGAVESIRSGPAVKYPAEITPDGRTLLFGADISGGTYKIMRLGLPGPDVPSGGQLRPILGSQFNEGGAKFSPDGKWLAYNTDETHPTQVFVRPYPDVDSGRWQVSTDGGINPTWSKDGREIYYRNKNRMMAVSVQTVPTFRPGQPRELFEGDYFYAPDLSVQYDTEQPDRQRFLMIKELPDNTTTKLVYVHNGLAELSRLVPAGR